MDYFKFLTAISIFIIGYLFITRTWISNDVQEEITRTVRGLYGRWNNCIRAQLADSIKDPNKLWDSLGSASKVCEATTIGRLHINGYPNKDETKYHILPMDKDDLSIIVTIGIGMDPTAEEKLKRDLSLTSLFFGADPVIANEKVFSPVGQFFPFAVSGRSGLSTASVLKNGTYQSDTAVHVDLAYFLKEMIEPSVFVFDDLWIDAEGGEYGMMPLFFKGGKLDRHNLTICQFNMEVHSPNDVQKKIFLDFIQRILDDERYVFLKLSSAAGHWRMYFLNFENPTCSRKYLVRVHPN